LQTLGSDQTLDLGGLGVRLGSLLLGGDLTANDELTNVVLLGQVEELSDVCERKRRCEALVSRWSRLRALGSNP
jgi:hypothetical protein